MRRRDDLRVERRHRARDCASPPSASLDGYVQYLLGARAHLRLGAATGPAAEADANASIDAGRAARRQPLPGAHRARPAAVAPRRRRRRGAHARGGVGARGRHRRAAAARAGRGGRAEHAWLDGDLDARRRRPRGRHALANARDDVWARGELAWWLWRAGEPAAAPRGPTPDAVRARDRRRLARRRPRRGRRSASPTSAPRCSRDAETTRRALEALAIFDGSAPRAPRRRCACGCAPRRAPHPARSARRLRAPVPPA